MGITNISPGLLNIFGWFAILSAAATLATFLTGILFFYVGDQFGKANDIASIFQMLFMLPLTLFFVLVLPAGMKVWASIAGLMGAAGMLFSAYGQGLLVLGKINFERSRDFFPGGAAVGLWLIVIGVWALISGLLLPTLAWFGIAAGAGYILTVIGFLRGGQSSMLFSLGALVLGIAFPVWGIWLGGLLLG